MMVTPRCPNPHGSPAATGGSFLQPTVSTGLRPSVSLQEARWVLTDSLLPAGAAHFGLPQGQVASLPLLPSEPCPLRERTGVPPVPLGCSPACQPQAPGVRTPLGITGCRSHGCLWPRLAWGRAVGLLVAFLCPAFPLTAGQRLSWLHLLSLPLQAMPSLSSPGAEILPPHQTGTSWEPGVLSWGNHGSPEGGTPWGTTRLCAPGLRRM